MAYTALALLFVILLSAILFLPQISSSQEKQKPHDTTLPPGPPGKPLLGNLLDIPPYHSWFQFEKWAKIYGPLYCLNIAGRNHIIISSEKIANDLLRERGNIYSSREQLPMAAQLVSDNLRPLFLPYDSVWRNGRKLMHSLINQRISSNYEPLQEEESLRVVRELIRYPSGYDRWFARYSAGVILRLGYSKYVLTGQETFLKRVIEVVHHVERVASPGAYLVDSLPSLMHIPKFLAPFKREAERLHAEEYDLFTSLQKEAVNKLDNGDFEEDSNFTTKWAASKDQFGLTDDEAAYVVGTLFEAGYDTTAAALASWTLAMVLHPSAFRGLQKEIDCVVGPDRLPSFSNMKDLPRVRATVKETMRWRPVTAGGLPHMSTQDDTYTMPSGEKYFLPKGSNVHPVQWAMYREPSIYPRPEEFIPERWLEPDWPTYKEPLTQHPNLQNDLAFGHGRRICPGQSVGERSLYIVTARIAWAFNIEKKVGKDGNVIEPPSYDYRTGFNVSPKPFAFDLTARDEKRKGIVEREWEAVWGNMLRNIPNE